MGVNNRLFFAIGNAAFISVFEISLVKTPAFAWVYPCWGALPVFVIMYIPFLLVAFYCYDWQPKRQTRLIGSMFAVDAAMLILFAKYGSRSPVTSTQLRSFSLSA
jgi:hypothetical protein